MTGLGEKFASVRAELEASNAAREIALRDCREIVRGSANSIRAIHRKEMDSAAAQIDTIQRKVVALGAVLAEHPSLLHAGYVSDAQKELVEASVLLSMVLGREIASCEELGVLASAYLNGIAEAGSECRRYVLDRMRERDFADAARLLDLMDLLYSELSLVDFPDALTGGLRRTVDAFRAVLERTRGDLTLSLQTHSLEKALEGWRKTQHDGS